MAEVDNLVGAKSSRRDGRILCVEARDPLPGARIIFVERQVRDRRRIAVRIGHDHRNAGLADVIGELEERRDGINVCILRREDFTEHFAGALRFPPQFDDDALGEEDVGAE